MPDTETQEQENVLIARHFLDAADKLFDEGDYVQTSEKLWGAASHALKALCIRRRWPHGKYAHLREALQRLAEETQDNSLVTGFKIAYGNHLNFYTDAMEPEDVGTDRQIVRGWWKRYWLQPETTSRSLPPSTLAIKIPTTI